MPLRLRRLSPSAGGAAVNAQLTRVDSLVLTRRRLSTEPDLMPAAKRRSEVPGAEWVAGPAADDAPTLSGRLLIALRTARRTFSASSEAAPSAVSGAAGGSPANTDKACSPSCFSPLGAAVAAAMEALATPVASPRGVAAVATPPRVQQPRVAFVS